MGTTGQIEFALIVACEIENNKQHVACFDVIGKMFIVAFDQ